MKAGDLVDFHTSAWVFEIANKRYANPGVVLAVVRACDEANALKNHRFVAEIMWADAQITREYDSFLRPREEKNKDEV